jgi:hypothetical protein
MAGMRYTRSLHSHTYGGSHTKGHYYNSDKFGGEPKSLQQNLSPALSVPRWLWHKRNLYFSVKDRTLAAAQELWGGIRLLESAV